MVLPHTRQSSQEVCERVIRPCTFLTERRTPTAPRINDMMGTIRKLALNSRVSKVLSFCSGIRRQIPKL